MGRIVVTEFISLDGVIEAPGGGEEYRHAGWTFEIDRGAEGGKFKLDEALAADALLLGRRTYEGFAAAWPSMQGEFADKFNGMPKYVVSSTLAEPEWNNTTVLKGDVAEEVAKLKQEQDGDIVVLADTRTEEGNMQLFGGTNPAAVLYLKADFAEKYPNTTQRLVNALYRGLQWLKTASAEDVVKTMPEEYYLGDRKLYERAVKASIEMYSKTGIITEKGMQNAYQLLAQFDPELKGAKVDLAKTFDDRFVRKAAAGM